MGTINGSHTVEIEAPISEVWEVAADVPASPAWQGSLETVETRETYPDGRAKVVDTTSDAKVKTTKQRLRFSYDEPSGMSWVQEKGDVKSLEGHWEFTELAPDRTRATYSLAIDPGRMLGMLVKGPVVDKVKEHLTKGAAEGLKSQVETGAPPS
jgi:uncharacterized membrane protein